MRNNWLNPPEWTRQEVLEFPGSVDGPWARYIDPMTVRGTASPLPQAGEGGERSEPGEGGRTRRQASGASAGSEPPSPPTPLPQAGAGSKDPHAAPRHASPSRIGTVRYPRLVPRDEECAKELKRRTLTNLYNQRPTWLELAHQKLDQAVFAAYGWDPALSDEDLLSALLDLNLKRANA